MSGSMQTERILDAYLAPEADRLPDRVLDAALADIARTPQRRAMRVPWRSSQMALRFGAVAAVLAIAVGTALVTWQLHSVAVLPSGPPNTSLPTTPPQASTEPSSSPSGADAWAPFSSSRFEYQARYPAGWVLRLGTADAAASALLASPDDRFDQLIAPCGTSCIGVTALLTVSSVPVDSEAALIAALVQTADEPCIPPRYSWEPSEIDGVRAWAFIGCDPRQPQTPESSPTFTVVTFAEGRGYVITAYVAPGDSMYQNTRDLMGAFIATIRLGRD